MATNGDRYLAIDSEGDLNRARPPLVLPEVASLSITEWHTSIRSTEASGPILIVATTPKGRRRHATHPPERRCRYPLMPSRPMHGSVGEGMAATDGGP